MITAIDILKDGRYQMERDEARTDGLMEASLAISALVEAAEEIRSRPEHKSPWTKAEKLEAFDLAIARAEKAATAEMCSVVGCKFRAWPTFDGACFDHGTMGAGAQSRAKEK